MVSILWYSLPVLGAEPHKAIPSGLPGTRHACLLSIHRVPGTTNLKDKMTLKGFMVHVNHIGIFTGYDIRPQWYGPFGISKDMIHGRNCMVHVVPGSLTKTAPVDLKGCATSRLNRELSWHVQHYIFQRPPVTCSHIVQTYIPRSSYCKPANN